MFTTNAEVVTILGVEMGAAATALSAAGQTAAVDDAMSELGFSFPVTGTSQCLWLVKRAIRYACNFLWIASAQSFKYKQINLQHRFDHYGKIVEIMDKEYEKALATNPTIFANVSAYKLFGDVIGAGFCYDSIGNDITYEDLLSYLNLEE